MRKKDDEKERRIRRAVMNLMLEEGLNGTSIAKIAKLAGVSPATVYIYYENKDDMLQDIYLQYSQEAVDYLLAGVQDTMDAAQLIETLARRYYAYVTHYPEAYCFVEQFAHCPSLSSRCCCQKSLQNILQWIEKQGQRPLTRHYSSESVSAILFYPIKAIAADERQDEHQKLQKLEELIEMIQKAIL